MMLYTNRHAERGLPLWAISAPLVGVPIMVGLLAITAPRDARTEATTPLELVQTRELAASVADHCGAQINDS